MKLFSSKESLTIEDQINQTLSGFTEIANKLATLVSKIITEIDENKAEIAILQKENETMDEQRKKCEKVISNLANMLGDPN